MKNITELTIPQLIEYVHSLEAKSGAQKKDIMAMDFYQVRDYVKSLETEIAHREVM